MHVNSVSIGRSNSVRAIKKRTDPRMWVSTFQPHVWTHRRADQSHGSVDATLACATPATDQLEAGAAAPPLRDWRKWPRLARFRLWPKLVSQPSPCLEVCARPWACGVTMYRKILDIAHAPYVTWGTQLRVDPRGTRAWRSFPWMAHLRRGNLWLHYGKSWAISGQRQHGGRDISFVSRRRRRAASRGFPTRWRPSVVGEAVSSRDAPTTAATRPGSRATAPSYLATGSDVFRHRRSRLDIAHRSFARTHERTTLPGSRSGSLRSYLALPAAIIAMTYLPVWWPFRSPNILCRAHFKFRVCIRRAM